MQTQLPFFPDQTKLINSSVGVFQKDGFIYYLHNGSPIFCHEKNDKNAYMYITANLVVSGLCKCVEISNALGVKTRNIERYAQLLRQNGIDYFFNRQDKRGECYKMTEEKLKEVQIYLDEGFSQKRSAEKSGISESTVRYHLRSGKLKKKS